MYTKKIAQFKQNQFDAIINQMNYKTNEIQQVVNRYAKFGLEPLNGKELQELFTQPKTLLVSKITSNENVNVNGFEVNKEKLFDLLDKPKGIEEFVNELEKLSKDWVKMNFYDVRKYTVTENVVSIDETVLNGIKEANTVYIENENQEKAFDTAKVLIEALNGLKTFKSFSLEISGDFIKESNGNFYLDANFLRTIK